MKFEEFKKEFNSKYGSISDFIDDSESSNSKKDMYFELESNQDEIYHDSYGDESSVLRRIFYFNDFDIYVRFTGIRQSYNGEEWNSMEEVIPTTKVINIFEPVKQ